MTTADPKIKRDYLATHGFKLIEQGYSVIPIQSGKKAPGFDGWEKSVANKDKIKEWLAGGFANAGVGILTKVTCAIDIDCLDEATALKFMDWCHEHIGKAPVRIGKFPKRLLLYRTATPFSKRRTAKYSDEWGEQQFIEVLGNGQQFVAYHIHPDTGKPYTWVDASPLDVRAVDLPELKPTHIDQLLEAFEAHAKAEGWSEKLKARNGKAAAEIDKDNPWVEDSQPIDIDTDELRRQLLMCPGAEEYDEWLYAGFALYHQFDGSEEGLALWNEWSETADNYDPDAIDRHWKSFAIEGKKRAPLTARYILRKAKEYVEKTRLELGVTLSKAFNDAKDLKEWEAARQQTRESEIDALTRSNLATVAKASRDRLTGTATPLYEIKKAIAYLPKRTERTPKWCEGWVYDTSEDKFFHTARKISTSKQGFDAMYDRNSLTKADILNARSVPSQNASSLALNLWRITTVDGRRYMPGLDAIYTDATGRFVNTYPEHEIPEKPEKEMPRDVANVARVKRHIEHLLSDPTEQTMLLDWLAWVVQNPGRHVNYAILLQGTEGDGKSFFGELLRGVMGVSNVKMVNANTVIRSDFTDWAFGQCVCCIEEIRLVSSRGVDKWEAINKVRPFITNITIEIHPKGRAVINVRNTTSYLLFSNYKDALPLDDNSRRYNVLFSRWQSKEQLEEFLEAQPNYYVRLYAALEESPGALRQWLLNHKPSSGFDPMGNAPATAALHTMIRKSKPEFIQLIDDIINDDDEYSACRDLLDVTELETVFMARGLEWPSPKTYVSMLERDGYESLGKVRVTDAGTHRFYSKHPATFYSRFGAGAETVDTEKVRRHAAERRAKLADTGL